MDKPGVSRQPYCPVCGKNGPLTEHHIIPRGQGGTKGPTIYLCGSGTTGCHGLAEDYRLHFDWAGPWFYKKEGTPKKDVFIETVGTAGWNPVSIYNEYDQVAPQTAEDVLGSLASDLRELKCAADQVDYFLSCELADALKRLHGDRKALSEWVADNLDVSPRSADSYLSKRLAYASLPDEAKDLGITNGYRMYLLTEKGHALRDLLDDFQTMGRSHFDTKYGLNKEPKEKHGCPDCGAVHTMRGE